MVNFVSKVSLVIWKIAEITYMVWAVASILMGWSLAFLAGDKVLGLDWGWLVLILIASAVGAALGRFIETFSDITFRKSNPNAIVYAGKWLYEVWQKVSPMVATVALVIPTTVLGDALRTGLVLNGLVSIVTYGVAFLIWNLQRRPMDPRDFAGGAMLVQPAGRS